MAHVKAGSSRAHQKANVEGKRRGLKVNQGQIVRGGQILVRQTGIVYKAGMNTKIARDSSVISRVEGVVSFSYLRRPNGVRTIVNVIPQGAKKVVHEVAPKQETVKKVAAKKPAAKKAVAPKKATTAKKAVAKKAAK